MITGAVVLPAVLVPVTVYVAWAAAAVGVPEMMPVVALRASPAGRAGDTAYEAMAPPVLEGLFAVMAVPTL